MDLQELISTLERIYFQEGNLDCAKEYSIGTVEILDKEINRYKRMVFIKDESIINSNTSSLN